MVFLPSDIAVVIPARAGSKRLKNKNRSQVGGISLLQRANLTLTSIGLNGLEIFTTDDQLLHEEAKKSGLFTPNLRPPELSHDDASTLSVVQYALGIHKAFHGVMPELVLLLQITSPFRFAWRISDALHRISDDRSLNSIFSASFANQRTYKTVSGLKQIAVLNAPFENENFIDANGNFYITRTDSLLSEKDFFPEKVGALITTDEEAIDIDTELDLKKAEEIAFRMSL